MNLVTVRIGIVIVIRKSACGDWRINSVLLVWGECRRGKRGRIIVISGNTI